MDWDTDHSSTEAIDQTKESTGQTRLKMQKIPEIVVAKHKIQNRVGVIVYRNICPVYGLDPHKTRWEIP